MLCSFHCILSRDKLHVMSTCLVTSRMNFDLLVKIVVSALSLYSKLIFPFVIKNILYGEILLDYIKSHSSLRFHPLSLASIDVSFKN